MVAGYAVDDATNPAPVQQGEEGELEKVGTSTTKIVLLVAIPTLFDLIGACTFFSRRRIRCSVAG